MQELTVRISISGFERMSKLLFKLLLFFVFIYLSDASLAWLLKYGMDGYYGVNNTSSVVFIGNSRVEAGIDPYLVSDRLKVPVAKFAIGGSNTSDRLEMIKYWLSEKSTPVNCIVYGVDQYSFRNTRFKGGEDAYRHFYPFIDNPSLAAYVKQNSTSLEEYYLKKYIQFSRFNNQDKSISVGYFMGRKDPYDYRVVNMKSRGEVQKNLGDYISSIDPDGIAVFDETLSYLKQRKIPVVLLYLPTTDVINELNGERYTESLILLRQFAEKYKGTVTLCDMFAGLSAQHELFGDYSHLNRKGQVQVSRLFSDYLLAHRR